jgi:hypothetical protein
LTAHKERKEIREKFSGAPKVGGWTARKLKTNIHKKKKNGGGGK